jgi:phage terminase large subunit-like protein
MVSSKGNIQNLKGKKKGATAFTQKEKDDCIKFVTSAFSSLEFFARNITGNMLAFEVPEFHREMYGFIPKIKRGLIAAPRGFAKSTITSVIYPLWLAVSQVSYKNIMIISASESLAVELVRKIKREIESNETILKLFGDMRTDKWSETHITIKGGVNIVARGAGAQIRGFRPDCLILDDIESDEGVESEEQRRKLKDWLFKSCLNTLLPSGQFLLVGTILSPISLLSDLLDTDNEWFKKKYMAYSDGVMEEGHELWKSLWPHSALKQRRAEIGSFAFSSEYMNSPLEDGATAIKESQIKVWNELPENMTYWITLDPAYSEESTSDYKVAVVVGVDAEMNRYLIKVIRTHDSKVDYMKQVLNTWKMYSTDCVAVGVPCSGTEREFYRSFTEFCHRSGNFPPFQELKNVFKSANNVGIRNKTKRIVASLQPLFEAGKYYIGPDHEEARNELLTIGSSKHDDVVDAMAYVESIVMNLSSEDILPKQSERDRYGDYQEVSIIPSNYGYAA